jgi:hypothetical protein
MAYWPGSALRAGVPAPGSCVVDLSASDVSCTLRCADSALCCASMPAVLCCSLLPTPRASFCHAALLPSPPPLFCADVPELSRFLRQYLRKAESCVQFVLCTCRAGAGNAGASGGSTGTACWGGAAPHSASLWSRCQHQRVCCRLQRVPAYAGGVLLAQRRASGCCQLAGQAAA